MKFAVWGVLHAATSACLYSAGPCRERAESKRAHRRQRSATHNTRGRQHGRRRPDGDCRRRSRTVSDGRRRFCLSVSVADGRERSRTVADGRKRSQPIATDRQWSPTGRSVVLLAVCLFFQKSIYLSIYPRARLRVSLSVSVCLSRTVANGRERSRTVANGRERSRTVADGRRRWQTVANDRKRCSVIGKCRKRYCGKPV